MFRKYVWLLSFGCSGWILFYHSSDLRLFIAERITCIMKLNFRPSSICQRAITPTLLNRTYAFDVSVPVLFVLCLYNSDSNLCACASFHEHYSVSRSRVMQSRKGNKTQTKKFLFYFYFLLCLWWSANTMGQCCLSCNFFSVVVFLFRLVEFTRQACCDTSERLGIVKTRKLFTFRVRQCSIDL